MYIVEDDISAVAMTPYVKSYLERRRREFHELSPRASFELPGWSILTYLDPDP